MAQFDKSLVWFRRDLRCFDNAALSEALARSKQVYCVFIFDTDILAPLHEDTFSSGKGANAGTPDRRVEFIHASITELEAEMRALGGALIVLHGAAPALLPELAANLGVQAVFVNRDYEPDAIERDHRVAGVLQAEGRQLLAFKDQAIFEQNEVLSLSGKPYTVFTPYKNAWLKKLAATEMPPSANPWLVGYLPEPGHERLAKPPAHIGHGRIPALQALGFAATNLSELGIPTGMSGGQKLLDEFLLRIADYKHARDYPAVKGGSYLSVHLRFGTVSVRSLARRALEAMLSGEGGEGAAVWLSELVWRDFYFMILYQNPHVAAGAFKPVYDKIEWEGGDDAQARFLAWCEGRTGYPLVDAAMAQINHSGYMHNRLRMVTACFLIKDLGIDWRWGERYFARVLNDFDMSANNGGWQWASSSGCDAQPYFRIFNPVTQSEKFDGQGKFIRHYLPQLAKLTNKEIHAPWLVSRERLSQAGVTLGDNYPAPLVDHAEARAATLARYAVVKGVPGD
ncbi:MAG: cryptochrome/photolyase family protein [Janthinobacterium lividum]